LECLVISVIEKKKKNRESTKLNRKIHGRFFYNFTLVGVFL
jgi:hypothetical protein